MLAILNTNNTSEMAAQKKMKYTRKLQAASDTESFRDAASLTWDRDKEHYTHGVFSSEFICSPDFSIG